MGKIQRVSKRVWRAVKIKMGFPLLSKQEKSILKETPQSFDDAPSVFVDFPVSMGRPTYNFFKFFALAGYQVKVKYSRRLFAEMKVDEYGRKIIDERLFTIVSKASKRDVRLSMTPKAGYKFITDHYYIEQDNPDTFFVPMAQHPEMYEKDLWNVPIPEGKRLKSVFVAGNFLGRRYTRIDKGNLFDIINRVKLFDFLAPKSYTNVPKTRQEYDEISTGGQLVVVNTENFRIERSVYRKELSRFAFFLAVPGVSVPFSHNVVEAMSAGCIPVLELNYAKWFHPKLTHSENAIIFDDLEDLDGKIRALLQMKDHLIEEMHEKVKSYYQEYLIPEKVVSRLIDDKINTIRYNSSSTSARHLRKAVKK